VLVACEMSGRVRDAFRTLGHDAWSVDLLPTLSEPQYHYQQDVFEVIGQQQWDLMIAFPPCTYLCGSGIHWNSRRPERAEQTQLAQEFFLSLANADIPRIAIENPVGVMSSVWRKPDQIIQPYDYGDDSSKKTCLWLKNLPPPSSNQSCRGKNHNPQ
jgi:hypothetical protein